MKIKKTLTLAVPFAILCSIYILIEHCFFDLSRINAIRYMVSQCLVILLPGLVLTKYLLGNKITSIIHWITISYALGYAFNILEYFVIYGFGFQKYCTVIVAIITIIALVLWFYKPIEVELRNISQQDYITLFVFGLYLIICIISYSGNNISPFIGQHKADINRDVQFWCSNAVALKLQFPPQSAYFAGARLYYHYFSSLHIAFISQVSGLSVFDVAFTLYPFGKCILLVGGLDYLLDRYELGLRKFFYMACMLFMTGWETISVVTYNWHLTEGPFGYDMGFAFGIWFFSFLLEQMDKKEFDLQVYILTMLMWMVCVGAKAPIAVILMVVPGIVCVWWLIKKHYKKAFSYGLTVIGIFVIICIECVGIIRVLNHTAESVSTDIGGIYSISQIVGRLSLPAKWFNIIPTILFVFFTTHPVLSILTIISSVILVWLIMTKRIKENQSFRIIPFLTSMLAGCMIGLFYNAGGKSEMYFTMAAFIPCMVYNLEIGSELNSVKIKDNAKHNIICLILILLSFIGLYCYALKGYDGGVIASIQSGYKKISSDGEFAKGIDEREARACEWIRYNTSETSVILSNRYLIYPQGSYYFGIFSERQQYLEATDLIYYSDLGIDKPHAESKEVTYRDKLIHQVCLGDDSSIIKIKNAGVNYIVQDNKICADKISDIGLNKVYDADDIVIYELD